MIYKIFLTLHIVSGSLGLLSGTFNMFWKKGDRTHRIVGKVFFYSMISTAISALTLSIIKPNHFLFIIGIFTFYLVVTGTRYLKLKRLLINQKPSPLDWTLVYAMLTFGLVFIAYGGYQISIKSNAGVILCIFGIISLLLVRQDFKIYKGNTKDSNYWLLQHITRMVAAYIAATTAFLVVNNNVLPGVIAWLLPTVIGTPLIRVWVKKHRIELKTNSEIEPEPVR
jgi:uncharacterized membrane protein